MTELNEDPERTADEMLDWLCWYYYDTGASFYHPTDTAEEMIDEIYAEREMKEKERARSEGFEHGMHGRAWSDAVEFYNDLSKKGFDPITRAHREVERSREEGLDLPGLDDWEWLPDHIKEQCDQ